MVYQRAITRRTHLVIPAIACIGTIVPGLMVKITNNPQGQRQHLLARVRIEADVTAAGRAVARCRERAMLVELCRQKRNLPVKVGLMIGRRGSPLALPRREHVDQRDRGVLRFPRARAWGR